MDDPQPTLEQRVRALEFQTATLTHVVTSLNATVRRHEAMLERLGGEPPEGEPRS